MIHRLSTIIFICVIPFHCYPQDSIWTKTIETQENLGVNNLIRIGLEDEIDGMNSLFPIWIKGKNDQSFVVLSEKRLHLLYEKKFNRPYHLFQDSCTQFCRKLFSDSIGISDLSLILPSPIEDYIVTPVDSIFLYPDSLKSEFMQKAFSDFGELKKEYHVETAILKLFRFGYLPVYWEGTYPPVISLYPYEFIRIHCFKTEPSSNF